MTDCQADRRWLESTMKAENQASVVGRCNDELVLDDLDSDPDRANRLEYRIIARAELSDAYHPNQDHHRLP